MPRCSGSRAGTTVSSRTSRIVGRCCRTVRRPSSASGQLRAGRASYSDDQRLAALGEAAGAVEEPPTRASGSGSLSSNWSTSDAATPRCALISYQPVWSVTAAVRSAPRRSGQRPRGLWTPVRGGPASRCRSGARGVAGRPDTALPRGPLAAARTCRTSWSAPHPGSQVPHPRIDGRCRCELRQQPQLDLPRSTNRAVVIQQLVGHPRGTGCSHSLWR